MHFAPQNKKTSNDLTQLSQRIAFPALQLAALLSVTECRLPAAETNSTVTSTNPQSAHVVQNVKANSESVPQSKSSTTTPSAILENQTDVFFTKERWYDFLVNVAAALPSAALGAAAAFLWTTRIQQRKTEQEHHRLKNGIATESAIFESLALDATGALSFKSLAEQSLSTVLRAHPAAIDELQRAMEATSFERPFLMMKDGYHINILNLIRRKIHELQAQHEITSHHGIGIKTDLDVVVIAASERSPDGTNTKRIQIFELPVYILEAIQKDADFFAQCVVRRDDREISEGIAQSRKQMLRYLSRKQENFEAGNIFRFKESSDGYAVSFLTTKRSFSIAAADFDKQFDTWKAAMEGSNPHLRLIARAHLKGLDREMLKPLSKACRREYSVEIKELLKLA